MQALKVAQAAMRAAPYSAHALLLMGRAKAAARCTYEAQEWYQKAIRLDPRCLQASILLAEIHRTVSFYVKPMCILALQHMHAVHRGWLEAILGTSILMYWGCHGASLWLFIFDQQERRLFLLSKHQLKRSETYCPVDSPFSKRG